MLRLPDGSRHTQPRGRWYRVRLPDNLSMELEYAAAKRHLAPEVLLTSIDQIILRDHLVDAILDDRNE